MGKKLARKMNTQRNEEPGYWLEEILRGLVVPLLMGRRIYDLPLPRGYGYGDTKIEMTPNSSRTNPEHLFKIIVSKSHFFNITYVT